MRAVVLFILIQYVIEQLWTSLHSPDKPLLDYLSSFYDELLSKWHSEFSWASQVFPDPLGMLSCVFSEGVESLHPPLAQCLSVAIQAAPQPLTTLLQLREVPYYDLYCNYNIINIRFTIIVIFVVAMVILTQIWGGGGGGGGV